ncbi:MAG: HsdR family type I site-specific deoxyribonuclease, partial [Chitinophagales bacterium]|nr:HsdR family type I site-specific deoxyribonuclease [Chitinophagales bacterium]
VYSQLLAAVCSTEAKYATTNTKAEFWSVWKEKDNTYINSLPQLVNTPLSKEAESKLFFGNDFRKNKDFIDYKEKYSLEVQTSMQDISLYGLFARERFVSIMKDFILFEGGIIKKVARFQQYFSINKIIKRIQPISNGKRQGGVIWHTQGSGKSLTMAMLARKIQDTIKNPQIVLVTDRVDLDRQITATLEKVEVDVINAESGKKLVELLKSNTDLVTTTIINKFQAAVNELGKTPLISPNIFVLIDEAHRTQYGVFNVNMELVLPNACFIVFTGTPLMKKEKSTAAKFGGIIDTYTITEAVEDGAIVPILYEGRLAVQNVNQEALDRGFDIVAEDTSNYEKAELKKKMSKAGMISKTDQNIYETALDISRHFNQNWGADNTGVHSGFRGMVVCPDKLTAVKYKKAFDLIRKVKTEVVMSSPDRREGNDDVHSSEASEVTQYYDYLRTKYGNDTDTGIIQQYEKGESIELLIVIDKLLTGFDVPQTIVMYLCRKLKEHTLLQAIARVNRVYPGKDYGYIIDYAGIMQELEEALENYSTTQDGFDAEDLVGTITTIQSEIEKLPQAYTELKDIFKTIKNKKDVNEYVTFLSDEAIREEFYAKFNAYARILKMALSTIDFHKTTPEERLKQYKDDLALFAKIRVAANNVYADKISFKQYEKQLQKLLDQHVITEDVIRLTDPIDILDTETFEQELEKLVGDRAKAERIAAVTSKYLNVNMDTDPVLFKKLSELIRETIADMRANRLSELEALKKLKEIKNQATGVEIKNVPNSININKRTVAVYRLLNETTVNQPEESALFFDELVKNYEVVDWEKNTDIINKIELEFGDYLIDVQGLTLDEADEVSKKCIEIAIANK